MNITFGVFETVIAILSAVGGLHSLIKGSSYLYARSKNQKRKKIQRKIQHYKEMEANLKMQILWVAEAVLMVFTAFALMFLVQMISGTKFLDELSQQLNYFAIILAWLIATYKLGEIGRMRNYSKTIERLEKQLEKLNKE